MRTPARAFSQMKIGLLLLVLTLGSAGCAKISDPQPPEVRIPLPAKDMAVRQLSDFVVLTVSKPERNTNGSEATTLKKVEVFRLSLLDSDDTAKNMPGEQFIKQAIRIFSIPSTQFPEYLNDKAFVFQDKFAADKATMYSRTFWYAVLFVNNKNQSAGLSNRVAVKPLPIPPPPGGLTAEGMQNCIQLKWTPPDENTDGSTPPRIAGYNIYRTENAGKFPSTPINSTPVQVPEFRDPDFRFGTTYYYAITTVGSLQQPYPESLPSSAVAILPRDVFPPEPPADFSAIFQGPEILLLWTSSPSPDVAGYRLYRQEKGSTDRQPVQADLIPGLSFRDTRVVLGKKYQYEIVAVDTSGNMSQAVKTDSEDR